MKCRLEHGTKTSLRYNRLFHVLHFIPDYGRSGCL